MSIKGGRVLTPAEAHFFDMAWRYFRLRNDRAAGGSILTNADAAWREAVHQRAYKRRADEMAKEREGNT